MAMDLAAFSALLYELYLDTLPARHWEKENLVGPECVPGQSPDLAALSPE